MTISIGHIKEFNRVNQLKLSKSDTAFSRIQSHQNKMKTKLEQVPETQQETELE